MSGDALWAADGWGDDEMPSHTVRRHLAYEPGVLFHLVADVERYPEFVPWWVAAAITRRDGDVYHTRQVVGLPMMRQEFQSKTELMRPNAIRVTSNDKPFNSLEMLWSFEPAGQGGCEVGLVVNFELASSRFGMVAGVVSGEGIRRLINAFESRARHVCSSATYPVTAVVDDAVVAVPLSPQEEEHMGHVGSHAATHHVGHKVCARRVVHRSVMHHDLEPQTVPAGG